MVKRELAISGNKIEVPEQAAKRVRHYIDQTVNPSRTAQPPVGFRFTDRHLSNFGAQFTAQMAPNYMLPMNQTRYPFEENYGFSMNFAANYQDNRVREYGEVINKLDFATHFQDNHDREFGEVFNRLPVSYMQAAPQYY